MLTHRQSYIWRLTSPGGHIVEAANGIPLSTVDPKEALVNADYLFVCGGMRIRCGNEDRSLSILRHAVRQGPASVTTLLSTTPNDRIRLLTARPLMQLTPTRYSSRLRLNQMQKLHLRNREICSDNWGQLSEAGDAILFLPEKHAPEVGALNSALAQIRT